MTFPPPAAPSPGEPFSSPESAQNPIPPAPGQASAPESDNVWTYRGYQLKAAEFNTAMIHLFRAEVTRANVWRQRLDTTTNWAVLTTSTAISFAFIQLSGLHLVMPTTMILVTIFLLIEARRDRYYELWSYRVRLMETDFFAAMLVPPFHPAPDWAESLAETLLHPQFPISSLEAIGRRLRRNYMLIFSIILLAWLARLYLVPNTALDVETFFGRAAIGALHGVWLLSGVLVYYFSLLAIALGTVGLREAPGEVLPRYGSLGEEVTAGLEGAGKAAGAAGDWFRPQRRRRQQLLTLIITDKAQEVSALILKEMRRGVTSIDGTGMYTGKEHNILMIALTVTEVPQMKSLVQSADPNAFVIVSPAQEILGKGFAPLQK
jgi:uncharacterized membrane protein